MSDKTYKRDIEPLISKGMKCELWGKPVMQMSRDELIGFIGFLDEFVTSHREESPTKMRRHKMRNAMVVGE